MRHACIDDANIIFGTSVDETYGDEIAVTVVATSFDVPPEAEAGSRGAAEPAPPPYQPAPYAPPSSWGAPPPQPQPPPEPPRRRLFGRF